MPSLRERKRYIAFEIISEQPVIDTSEISKAIWSKSLEFLGESGCAEAGIIILPEKYNKTNQRGMMRVSNKSLNKVMGALTLIQNINNKKAIVKTVGVSGIFGKTEKKYIAS